MAAKSSTLKNFALLHHLEKRNLPSQILEQRDSHHQPRNPDFFVGTQGRLANRSKDALASCESRASGVPVARVCNTCLASEVPMCSSTSKARWLRKSAED